MNKIIELPRYIGSSTSLNLVCTIEQKSLDMLRGLPEITEAWNSDNKEIAIEKLHRGVDVLGSVMNGSKEHMSAIKLLADCQNFYGRYKYASRSIRQIRSMLNDNRDDSSKEEEILLLAQAKAEFNDGDFREALQLGKKVQNVTQIKDGKSLDQHLFLGCSLTAIGLSELMIYLTAVNETNHLDTQQESRIIEILNNAVISLESSDSENENTQVVLARSGAMHNLNIASSALRTLYSTKNLTSPNHSDNKISDTLSHLKSHSSLFTENLSPYYHHLGQSLLASMYCTSAYDILFTKKEKSLNEDDLKKASNASQKALKICESLIQHEKYSVDPILMSKSLFLLATCFANANSAVTSEGLFNTAIDILKQQLRQNQSSQLSLIVLRDAYNANANLYDNWEKREKDAENLKFLANGLEEDVMFDSWQRKPGVISGLWFYTYGDFCL